LCGDSSLPLRRACGNVPISSGRAPPGGRQPIGQRQVLLAKGLPPLEVPEPHRNVDIALLEGDPHHVSDRGRYPVARRQARERPHRLSVDTGYHDLEPAQLVGIVVIDDARSVDAAPGVAGSARLAGVGGGLNGQPLDHATLGAVADAKLLADVDTLHPDRGFDYPVMRHRARNGRWPAPPPAAADARPPSAGHRRRAQRGCDRRWTSPRPGGFRCRGRQRRTPCPRRWRAR
jgi:hypothetical protein